MSSLPHVGGPRSSSEVSRVPLGTLTSASLSIGGERAFIRSMLDEFLPMFDDSFPSREKTSSEPRNSPTNRAACSLPSQPKI